MHRLGAQVFGQYPDVCIEAPGQFGTGKAAIRLTPYQAVKLAEDLLTMAAKFEDGRARELINKVQFEVLDVVVELQGMRREP